MRFFLVVLWLVLGWSYLYVRGVSQDRGPLRIVSRSHCKKGTHFGTEPQQIAWAQRAATAHESSKGLAKEFKQMLWRFFQLIPPAFPAVGPSEGLILAFFRSPSSALLPFLFGEGSPTKID